MHTDNESVSFRIIILFTLSPKIPLVFFSWFHFYCNPHQSHLCSSAVIKKVCLCVSALISAHPILSLDHLCHHHPRHLAPRGYLHHHISLRAPATAGEIHHHHHHHHISFTAMTLTNYQIYKLFWASQMLSQPVCFFLLLRTGSH